MKPTSGMMWRLGSPPQKFLGNSLHRETKPGVNLANFAVIGSQWGDEGKGKVVDILARKFDYVVRFQGGHNAGHTVVFEGERFALHVMPSGIFQKSTVNLIGNGVVVEPFSLIKEIEGLRARGVAVTPENFNISDRAHIIMPYHGIIDRFRDSLSGERKIGTTGRGIGPAYEWKAARRGFRFADLAHPEHFRELLTAEMTGLHQRFQEIEELAEWSVDNTIEKLQPAFDFLKPFVVDSVTMLAKARAQNKTILFEGAQAVLLDIDFGTYPYVTSSNACAVGISAGAGVPPNSVHCTVGIFKAYATRVGEGPFPTELHDHMGEALRKAGLEFGTTTGRPRRCGWLDLVALKYAQDLNGLNILAMMKQDVLDGLDEIKIAYAYELDGEEISHFPASIVDLGRVKPLYHTLPGWKQTICDFRNFDDLPQAAKDYVYYIEKAVGCPIGLVSVGPDRAETIIRDERLQR